MNINTKSSLLLGCILLLSGFSVEAEEVDFDKLLLEMDTLASEVDNMQSGYQVNVEETEDETETKIESNEPETETETIAGSTATDDKVASKEVVNEVVNNVAKTVAVDNAGEDKAKALKANNSSVGDQVAIVSKPPSIETGVDDGFGDFSGDFKKNDAMADDSKGGKEASGEEVKPDKLTKVVMDRDPFAPSSLMVREYKKKVDELKAKKEAIRLAQIAAAEKSKAGKKKKEAAERLAAERKKEADRLAALQKAGQFAAVQQARALALPKMNLKGLIKKSKKEVLALLDIQGMGTHIVRKGDTVSLGSKGTIKILEINNLSLKIEAGSMGDTLVVR